MGLREKRRKSFQTGQQSLLSVCFNRFKTVWATKYGKFNLQGKSQFVNL